MSASTTHEGWVVLELMGHRRLAGHLTEATIGGAPFLRLDVPGADGQPAATQYYAATAVYCITPTSEDTARQVAAIGRPAPVARWELPPASDDAIEAARMREEEPPW